jgi:hypothetical protein
MPHAMTLNRSFFLLTTAFLLMCTTAIALGVAFASEGIPTKPYTVGFVSGFLTLIILRFEGRRDLDAVLTLVVAFLAFLAMGIGIYLIAADRSGLAPKVSFGFSLAGAATLGVWSYRRQRTESPDFPNLLARSVHRGAIFESEGVQFTGFLEPAQGGKPHFISILLQNCFDSPCEVTLNFDPAGNGAYMRFHARHNVTVGAAEIVKVTMPVVTPTYPGKYALYYSIEVKGLKGKRVRLWRAQEATTRVKASTTLVLLAFGHLAVGGGIRFTIGPLPYDIWNSPLPAPVQSSIWKPRIGAVPYHTE